MIQFGQLWANLVPRQRLILIAAALAVAGGIYGLREWNRERGFEPLFSAMAPEDAGAVTANLKEQNIDFRLADGGATILVKAERVAMEEVRQHLVLWDLPEFKAVVDLR